MYTPTATPAPLEPLETHGGLLPCLLGHNSLSAYGMSEQTRITNTRTAVLVPLYPLETPGVLAAMPARP